MNRVHAAGARARRAARTAERERRGLPARRRTPGALPSARLRADWPGAPQRGPSAPRLLGTTSPRPITRAPRERRVPPARGGGEVITHPVTPPPTEVVAPVVEVTPVVETAPPVEVVPAVEVAPVVEAVPVVEVVPPVEAAPVAEVAPVVEATTAPTAVAPVPSAPPVAPTDDFATPPRRARFGRPLVLVAVAAVLAAGSVVGLVAGTSSSGPRPTQSATVPSVATGVSAWLRDNVAASTPVVSDDPAVVTDLSGRYLTVARVDAVTDAPVGSVVVTAARSDSAPSALAEGRTYVTVARFAGSTPLEVGEVVAADADAVAGRRTAERDTARAATAGLLRNPGLTVADAARGPFDDATLDLRAAAFLAALAGSGSVQVTAAPADPAETSAGLPVRRLVVTVDDRTALAAAADRTRAPYAPVLSTPGATAGPAGSVLLTWSVLADPALVVS